jgi:hypothetical protein
MNDVTERITTILVERFNANGADNFILDEELNRRDPVTDRLLEKEEREYVKKELLKRIQYKESHDSAILIPVSIVSDPKEHEEWYNEWLSENNTSLKSYYWKRLEGFLEYELTSKYGPERAGRIIKSIDEATFSIISKLANPERNEFSYKGLVVGYVQSGKTANFTALIAKAADSGYKLIIVLAGIHNVLRRQTQVRIDREITGKRDIPGPENYISLPGAAKMWTRLTTANNDFSTVNLSLFSDYCIQQTPTIAIVKKNVSILNNLIDFIIQAEESLRDNIPVLIIDDEADQASIDTNANNTDTDPSRTNECIRNLLRLFKRKAYVGYTATPFANVLIDMATEHNLLLDDLYPRNFIVSLPEPDGYFGTSMIFQGDLADNFVKKTSDTPNAIILKGKITEYLSLVIDQFIMSCAIRNLRGDKMKPMSMLVHVSHRISHMAILNGIIRNYISDIKGRYNDPNFSNDLKKQFKKTLLIFEKDAKTINQELNLGYKFPEFELIWKESKDILDILKIMELNSLSEDNLDYTTGEEIKLLAIGGNQLSRGLTLEGLMTSYYLRASRQYDTLLQMGRWFGYRKGYEDLTRIHTTTQIFGFFEDLALVEEELRSEIYRYEEEQMTPIQMAIAIRAHRNLKVTARNKMGAAKPRQSSYSGSLTQTTWLPLDQPEILRSNYELGNSFIGKINNEIGFTKVPDSGVYLANEKIDGEVILENFLNQYIFVDPKRIGGPGLDSESLKAYIFRRINDQSPELTEWSFAVAGNIKPTVNSDTIIYGGLNIIRTGRSRKVTSEGYNVGVLTESAHLEIDIKRNTRSPQNPLIILYLINKESRAHVETKPSNKVQRIDLFSFVKTEKIDVLGIAIVLPISRLEPNSYLGQ